MQLLREGPAVGLRAVVTGDRSGAARADLHGLRRPAAPAPGRPRRLRPGRAARQGPAGVDAARAARCPWASTASWSTRSPCSAPTPRAGPGAALQSLARAAGGASRMQSDRVEGRAAVAGGRAADAHHRGPDARPGAVASSRRPRCGRWSARAATRCAPLGLDLLAHGPGAVIAGPSRSGRSSALLTAAQSLLSRGTPVVARHAPPQPAVHAGGRAGRAGRARRGTPRPARGRRRAGALRRARGRRRADHRRLPARHGPGGDPAHRAGRRARPARRAAPPATWPSPTAGSWPRPASRVPGCCCRCRATPTATCSPSACRAARSAAPRAAACWSPWARWSPSRPPSPDEARLRSPRRFPVPADRRTPGPHRSAGTRPGPHRSAAPARPTSRQPPGPASTGRAETPRSTGTGAFYSGEPGRAPNAWRTRCFLGRC